MAVLPLLPKEIDTSKSDMDMIKKKIYIKQNDAVLQIVRK